MLVLSRKDGESIVIGGNVLVTVVEIRGNRVKIGLTLPDDVSARRREVPPEEWNGVKVKCVSCNGTGSTFVGVGTGLAPERVVCPDCLGKGKVPRSAKV